MRNLRDEVLDRFGDEGADTFSRYYSQIEYTALWCIRLLSAGLSINAVIPESVEDVIVLRSDKVELHQVKTRDESQGPWTTAEILPLLCKMYYHRNAFQSYGYEFHFVSDGRADTKTQLGKGYGPLFRLKQLLEIHNAGLPLSSEEQDEFENLQEIILPRIQSLMLSEYSENLTDDEVRALLMSTRIETNAEALRHPNCDGALADALEEQPYGAIPYTMKEIREIHGRIISCVIGKILQKTISKRRIELEDVLQCRTPANKLSKIDLSNIPGVSTWEKKAHLGGFDVTEFPAFNRQRLLAKAKLRGLEPLGFSDDLARLSTKLIDQHAVCRDEVCRSEGLNQKVGPEILRKFRSRIAMTIADIPALREHVDEQICLGIAWDETNNCHLWWHPLDQHIEAHR